MTNTPGWASPGSSSDSPEPEDGDSPGHSPARNAQPAAPEQQEAAAEPSQPAQEADAPASAEPGPAAQTSWSQRQPPPAAGWGQWAPPPGPRVPPPEQGGPRWGPQVQPTAWQPHGSWGTAPAPAPKPGVIPLRPLGAGEIIDGAIATLRRHWRAVVGITFAIALVTQAIAVVVEGLFIDDSRIDEFDNKSNPSVHDLLRAFRDVYAGLGLTILVTALGVLVASAILTVVVSRAVLGRGVTAGEAWRDARPRLLQLIGLALLLTVGYVAVVAVGALPGGLIAVAGAKTLGASLAVLGMTAGLVVAVRLWILFVLAPPALMLERQSIVGALKRSAKLVRGSWWRVLGVQLLSIVLVYIVSALIQMPFALIASAVTDHDFSSFVGSSSENPSWTYLVLAGIGGVVAATITLPVSSGVTTLLYMDQRIRRESLDIELARAAEKH